MWIIIIIGIVFLIAYFYTSREDNVAKRFTASNAAKYPKFKKALQIYYGQHLNLHSDSDNLLSYRIDKLERNRKIGDIYFILGLYEKVNFVCVSYKMFGRNPINSDPISLGTKSDAEVEVYQEHLIDCVQNVFSKALFP